jgi:hypothetical protein
MRYTFFVCCSLSIIFTAFISSWYATLAATSCNPWQYLDTWLCISCDPWTYSEWGIATSCTPCSEWSFSSEFASSSCNICPVWRFQDQQWQTECIECSIWTIAASTGSTSCTAVSAGLYVDIPWASEWIACPVWFYNAITWQHFCSACPIGTFNNSEWSTECNACTGNTFSNLIWATSCESCESWSTWFQETYTWDYDACDNRLNCPLWIAGNNMCVQTNTWSGRSSSIDKSKLIIPNELEDQTTTNWLESEEQSVDLSWVDDDLEANSSPTYIPTSQEKEMLNRAVILLQEFITSKNIPVDQLIEAIQIFAEKHTPGSRKYMMLMRLIELLS